MMEAGRSKPWPKILKAMTGERELSAKAINEYFQPLYGWLVAYRNKHGYPVGWAQEDLSEKVLHRKAGKFESGQERSGILKTNNKGISLSINIPSISLGGSKAAATKNNDVQTERGNDETVSVPMIDLAKLLSSGDRFSVSTSETSANTKDGATTITNKEFNVNNDDITSGPGKNTTDNGTQNSSTGSNTTSNGTQNSSTGSNTTSSGTQNSFTGSNTTSNGTQNSSSGPNPDSNLGKSNSTTNSSEPHLSKFSDSGNSSSSSGSSLNGALANSTSPSENNATLATDKNTASPINQTLEWQSDMLAKQGNASLVNETTGRDGKQNATTSDSKVAQNATARDISPCHSNRRDLDSSSPLQKCVSDLENVMDTISVSPGELLQHVLMKKVKSVVQKTLPQANVEKTKTGFTVNLDLNPKDEIPSHSLSVTGKTRQQHVNVFIAPKGVVVKPKSSEQLMKPSFVPVQNKDNLELRGGK